MDATSNGVWVYLWICDSNTYGDWGMRLILKSPPDRSVTLHPRPFWGKKMRILSRIFLAAFGGAIFILAATATYSAEEKALIERRKLSKEDNAVIGAMKLRTILRLVKIPGRELRF